jgi:Glycosyl hydrolases family 16
VSERLDRSAYVVEFDESFPGPRLDESRWVPHYLPQWTTPERSGAHYDLNPEGLRLRIDADQPPWRPEDGELRVSNLQTGSFSGPAGSSRGQHRHAPGLTVVNPQPTRRLYTPSSGLVEARLRAVPDPTLMLAFWLIGFEEDSPEDSGEICVVELFGDAIGRSVDTERSELSIGVKAHHDPRLRQDMARVPVDFDASEWHDYAATWDAEGVQFFVDDVAVRTVEQVIGYPLQLMVDLFEFPGDAPRDPHTYPKVGDVAWVRGYRPSA